MTTYHSYVGQLQQTTGLNQNRGLKWDEFIEAAPQMLLDAAGAVRERDPDALFDAIIVDEAQDFDEGIVNPEDIIILTPSAERRSIWKSDTLLGNFVLTWNMDTDMHMAVRVCTIYSFKGLESAVIILTELDKLYPDVAQQLMYVGLSRARNHVVVLGDQSDLKT